MGSRPRRNWETRLTSSLTMPTLLRFRLGLAPVASMGTSCSQSDLVSLEKHPQLTQYARTDRTIIFGSTFKTCAICAEDYLHGDTLRLLNACGHCFHKDCADAWTNQTDHPTCPVCMAPATIQYLEPTLRKNHTHHRGAIQREHVSSVQLIDLSVHESWKEWLKGLIKTYRIQSSRNSDTASNGNADSSAPPATNTA